MHYTKDTIYHIFNQGNNKQNIFFERENYLFFLKKIRKHLSPHAEILCYCLMPNHFHLLIVPKEKGLELSKAIKPSKSGENIYQQNLSHQIGVMISGYTKAINKRYNRSGSLFRGKTKAKDGFIDDLITIDGKRRNLFFRLTNDYAIRCFHYIHDNPSAAKLCELPEQWEFSSARDYKGIRNGTLCNQILAKKLLF